MTTKVQWQYYFARKFSLQRFEIVLRVFISDFYWQHFRVRLRHIMIKPAAGGNHAIWLDAQEYERAFRRIFRVVCKNWRTFRFYQRLITLTQRRWLAAAKQVGSQAPRARSRLALAKLYDQFIFWQQEHFNKPIWIPFPIEPLLSKAAAEALRRVLQRANQLTTYPRWFEVVFASEKKNAITRLQEALLTVAIAAKSGQLNGYNFMAALEKLAKTYNFIPCYDLIDAPWEQTYFIKEVRRLIKNKSLSDLRQERRELQRRYQSARQEFQRLLRLFSMTKRERELLKMVHALVVIKDERDDYRRQGSYYARPLLAAIGRRLGLTLKAACYLTIAETKNFLHGTAPAPLKREIAKRMGGYLLLHHKRQPLVVASGARLKQMAVREIKDTASITAGEVRGTVGARGSASGPAVIVHNKHDLRRVGVGAIMVAVTTNPDFVPAMRRCRAIVTDEGGITSHAAIVSREFKIPCVVGTKNATAVFRDGEKLLVDAYRGIVKKIHTKNFA